MTEQTVAYRPQQCMFCTTPPREITLERRKYDAWRSGAHIQTVWPDKSDGEREEIRSGIHPQCWDDMFGGLDESEE